MRRVRNIPVIAAAALVVTLSACGSNVENSPETIQVTQNSATSSKAGDPTGTPPVPTAAELEKQMRSVLKRGLPDKERLDLIEDGNAFKSNIPDLFKAMDENPGAKYGIKDPVEEQGDGTLTATFWLQKDGTEASERTAQVIFIAQDGKWRVSKNDVCAILQMADYKSKACE
ncbi:hypothetical protein GOEFS_106_00280 [Gordonia effusa NBRC 100432]|uniref:Low molecular weight antigen MTB12-like C-terminal domain-containing protein n=1 Tax=Gordonia effusa NBRC 100432 TaxID=1077974 RepID=H0R4Y1_9ACTN|nr:hypothetical protein [Gordonia effusa]GAB20132.1 hypothetical protein GOEFS_106_00280 [Gordonia effusa NBRC 100432]